MVKTMAKVRITQSRSDIKRPERQQRTLRALGLGKVDKFVEVEFTPQIKGMVQKVNHLITVTEL
jgi:large subunit ribosomal protein L30